MHIGSYQVLLEIARGGMGKVYLARTLGPGGVQRLVAIKRAHEHLLAASELFSDRLLDEACIAAHVHHSNVVGVHQAGSDEDGYYLVLDYVEGESLKGLIDTARQRNQRVPPPIVLRIVCDALAGLHAAHEATDAHGHLLGILHRDVSPQNLLVGRDGVTRLSDFGIAKSVLSRVVTAEHYVQGKLAYMAPEYLRREPVARAVDIYGMGMTLWLALAGESPWPGAEEAQVLHSILLEGVPSLFQRAPSLGTELAAVVDRACRREASERFQTAREMLDALEAVAATSVGGLARHVEVAEFVEALVGPELSQRRSLVKARRDEMDRENEAVASERGTKPASERGTKPASATDSVAREAPDLSTPSGLVPRRWEGPRLWVVGATVMALGMALAIAVAARSSTMGSEPRIRGAAASSPAKPVVPTSTVAPRPAAALPGEVAPMVTTPPASTEPPRAPARPSGASRRSPRARLAPASPQAAPFSSVNPYR
jgi:serine/threonine protein kinase